MVCQTPLTISNDGSKSYTNTPILAKASSVTMYSTRALARQLVGNIVEMKKKNTSTYSTVMIWVTKNLT